MAEMAVAAGEVQAFRAAVQAGGFVRANATGELVRGDVMVATAYRMGEFTIDIWRRDRGAAAPGTRRRIRLTDRAVPGSGERLGRKLVRWADANDETPQPWPPKALSGTQFDV